MLLFEKKKHILSDHQNVSKKYVFLSVKLISLKKENFYKKPLQILIQKNTLYFKISFETLFEFLFFLSFYLKSSSITFIMYPKQNRAEILIVFQEFGAILN